jgi:hypothetical protein
MQTAKNPFGISKDLEAHHVPLYLAVTIIAEHGFLSN